MTTETTNASSTSPFAVSPAPLRDVVASIVLATTLPMPTRISFQGEAAGERGASILSMVLRTVADGLLWASYLGGKTRTRVTPDGRTWLDEGVIHWRGWHVQLHACDERTPDSHHLGEPVISALTALAGGEPR